MELHLSDPKVHVFLIERQGSLVVGAHSCHLQLSCTRPGSMPWFPHQQHAGSNNPLLQRVGVRATGFITCKVLGRVLTTVSYSLPKS